MNAKEALQLTGTGVPDITSILNKIKRAALDGKTSCQISEPTPAEIIALKKLGYTPTRFDNDMFIGYEVHWGEKKFKRPSFFTSLFCPYTEYPL